MVKLFKVPGRDNNKVRFRGHGFFSGGTVYDNDMCKIPEKLIPKIWWVDKEDEGEDGVGEKHVDKESDVVAEPKAKTEPVEEPKEEYPKELPSDDEPKELPSDDNEDKEVEALKKLLKDTYSVRELKAKCKKLGLSGYSVMNEEMLVNLLIENGVKG